MKHNGKHEENGEPSAFSYPYVVLSILFLLTIGATFVYHQNSSMFADESGERWTPVVFLIGVCISLLLFGMTHRDAVARSALVQRTRDLIASQRENHALLDSEQRCRIAAEQANLAKDQFLAVVSHELKTPLHAIAGWTRILRTKGLAEETRDAALDKIEKNLRIQASIVEELLNFSDVMSSDGSQSKKSVCMREIFESAVASVNAAAFQKGVSLATQDELDSEHVLADSQQLMIAIVYVLTNAVKFTPTGGRVEARAFKSDGHIKCVVADTGFGIPPDFLPHVFEQYKQSQTVPTRQFGGLGLGLTIADRIVKMHDGTITAESSGLGSGATFTISIPAR